MAAHDPACSWSSPLPGGRCCRPLRSDDALANRTAFHSATNLRCAGNEGVRGHPEPLGCCQHGVRLNPACSQGVHSHPGGSVLDSQVLRERILQYAIVRVLWLCTRFHALSDNSRVLGAGSQSHLNPRLYTQSRAPAPSAACWVAPGNMLSPSLAHQCHQMMYSLSEESRMGGALRYRSVAWCQPADLYTPCACTSAQVCWLVSHADHGHTCAALPSR